MKDQRTVPIMIFLRTTLAIVALAWGLIPPSVQADDKLIGTPAPEFALQDLDGQTVHIADFSGKVVILDFWATWCPPCRKELPDFIAMQSKYGDKGFTVVGLSVDAGGAHDVRTYAQENKVNFNYPILIANEQTANAYGGVVGIPTTFVIDRKGYIVKRFVGYTPASEFEETIRPLLQAS